MSATEDLNAELAPPATPGMRERVAALTALRKDILAGPDALATQPQGELTAHERMGLLFDPGTFIEIEALRRHRATGFGLECSPTRATSASSVARSARRGMVRHGAKLVHV
jgi:acetyl-CoA carboxylase carboxyltransferase component